MNGKIENIIPVLAASVLIFCLIAVLVSAGLTKGFDNSILLSMRQTGNTSIPLGPAWIRDFMTDISSLGSVSVIVVVTVFAAGCLLLKRSFKMLRVILFAAIGGGVLDLLLKEIFSRPRPEIVPHLVNAEFWSFPSGHSVMSAAVYLSLAAIAAPVQTGSNIRRFIPISAVVIVLLIGISRIYLGVHYPTDVLAGWLLGTAWCCSSIRLAEGLKRNNSAEAVRG